MRGNGELLCQFDALHTWGAAIGPGVTRPSATGCKGEQHGLAWCAPDHACPTRLPALAESPPCCSPLFAVACAASCQAAPALNPPADQLNVTNTKTALEGASLYPQVRSCHGRSVRIHRASCKPRRITVQHPHPPTRPVREGTRFHPHQPTTLAHRPTTPPDVHPHERHQGRRVHERLPLKAGDRADRLPHHQHGARARPRGCPPPP